MFVNTIGQPTIPELSMLTARIVRETIIEGSVAFNA
jgi:hypothetical protein